MNKSNLVKSIGEPLRRTLRGALPNALYSQCAALLDASYGIKVFGFKEWRKLFNASRTAAGAEPAEVHLRPLSHPFYIRPGTPDADLVLYVLARESYGYMLPSPRVRLIIDAGANIGDTTVWYANRFPESVVIGVEPDPDNFAILAQNCAPYGNGIRLVKGALWPVANRSLAVTGATYTVQVRESKNPGELLCLSVDPLTILRDTGLDAIDIFKIDIEGAELELFSGDCDEWLQRTRNIAIEIHTPEARDAVFAATSRNGFRHSQYRDLHVFWK
jgi:FkbM family methyltransferase